MSALLRAIVIFFDVILWMLSTGSVFSGLLFLWCGINCLRKALISKDSFDRKDNRESGLAFSVIGVFALIAAFALIMLSLMIIRDL